MKHLLFKMTLDPIQQRALDFKIHIQSVPDNSCKISNIYVVLNHYLFHVLDAENVKKTLV